MKEKDTRYQHQPWYIKLWRRRYYIPIPYKVLRSKIRNLHEPWAVLWSIHIGLAQCAMKWTYKMDEVFDEDFNLKSRKPKE